MPRQRVYFINISNQFDCVLFIFIATQLARECSHGFTLSVRNPRDNTSGTRFYVTSTGGKCKSFFSNSFGYT